MARRILAWGLGALGITALAIATSMFLLGAQTTGSLFDAPLIQLGLKSAPVTGLDAVNADNELRFYAVLWFSFGVIAVRTARDVAARLGTARALLAIFFMGGIGRGLSWIQLGAPDLLFQILMGIELILPVVLLVLSRGVRAERPRFG